MGVMLGNRIPIRGPAQRDGLRQSGAVARDILLKTAEIVKAGVTTREIDRFAADQIRSHGATSAFLGYRGFKGNICVSVNEEIVHGIGSSRIIEDGDVVSIDIGVHYKGWVGDNALTVPVGNVARDTLRLLAATEEALHIAISHARDGEMLGTLCHSVEAHVAQFGFTVVREFVGHGVGRKLHEEPQVPNYGEKGARPRLKAGMTLAIEPMINLGVATSRVLADGWTAVTTDRKPSAHFEHMVLITEGEPEILTWREKMFPAGVASIS
jgi:methionyl aminopeptidase